MNTYFNKVKNWIALIAVGLVVISVLNAKEPTTSFGNSSAARSVIATTGQFDGNRVLDDLENNGMIVSHRISGHSGMEWPKGNSSYSVFASGVWYAGKVGGDLRCATAEYGPEMVAGPYGSNSSDAAYKIWKVNKSDLGDPLASYDFQNWPVADGAPWVDVDGDGVYSPMPGGTDHPEFLGDQVIWFVRNDGDATAHTIFQTLPLGIEVQTTIFGFDRPDAFGDMMFVKELIVNKGGNTIDDMYIGLWSDPDLGDAGDDFVGCDTTLGLGYCWNDGDDSYYSSYSGGTPAVGYDFFQGPMVPSAGDTAFFNGRQVPGYRNLSMTSFSKYINGDPVYTDPNDVQEVYNYMQGLMRDGSPFPVEASGGSNFVHPGNPSDDTGSSDDVLVDPDLHASGDRRFLMNAGPFNMAPSDSQEVVFAIMHAAAGEAKASVDYLKQVDLLAQLAYDIQFALPASPPNPTVEVSTMPSEILLSWDGTAESYNQIDVIDKLPVPVSFDTTFATGWFSDLTGLDVHLTVDTTYNVVVVDDTTSDTTEIYHVQYITQIDTTFEGEDTYFTFEGYNVYQHETGSGTGATKRIATFDLNNGVAEVMDAVFDPNIGETVTMTVQHGTNSGIQRHLLIDQDQLGGGVPLKTNRKYYFSVTAYGYNQYGIPKTLESSNQVITVQPQASGTWAAHDSTASVGDMVATARSAGTSDGSILVKVVDPTKLTGDSYEVSVNEDHFYQDTVSSLWMATADPAGQAAAGLETKTVIYWSVMNTTTNTMVVERANLQSGLKFEDVVDGVAVPASTAYGENANPVFDGVQVMVNGPSNGIHGIYMVHDGVTALEQNSDAPNASALQSDVWLTYPDGLPFLENSNGGYYFATQGGGTPADQESYYARVFRSPGNWANAIPNDFEMRFTETGSKAWLAYTSGAVIDVPFELWNVGVLSDPSDDYQMICWIYDFDGSGTYNWHGELEDSGAENDPGTDWVYWRNPNNTSPGTVGYDETIASEYAYPDFAGSEVMARTIWNNWNGYGSTPDSVALSELSSADSTQWTADDTATFLARGWFLEPANSLGVVKISGDYAKGLIINFPATGSVYRWVTNKPNTGTDKFTFSTDGLNGQTVAYEVNNVNVWPNPYFGYNPEERDPLEQKVQFTHLPADGSTTKIRIFDLAGQPVKTLTHTGSTQYFEWDLTNNFDVPVASGMYLAHVETANGGSKVLKLGIVQPEQRIDVY
ncbi:MAG: hypothetical protein CMG55_01685 [Candidatus Marinimicrobia bacterium]|nr:hypothetical protein [Candidatus Neomarinimicrobiota bacterium]|tara:strand:+ start:21465 stop:25115 length:3651 start_codon:yes stop_codon:yes gene_type:complete